MDKLSNLPTDITECILLRMPLKDAVRTSILSREWRHKWTSIPCLEFTRECLPASCIGLKTPASSGKLASIVNQVLSLHTGPVIQVFRVKETCPPLHVDSWLHRVCQSYVKELEVKGHPDDHHALSSSSSIYTCATLTHLKLNYCTLNPPPPLFKGFRNLITLNLEFVSSRSKHLFQRILRGCPVLENLSVRPMKNVRNLRINNVPRLRSLVVMGRVQTITFGDTCAELSVVRVVFDNTFQKRTKSYMAKFFSKIPNVETLQIEGRSLLSLSCGVIPNRLPTPCYHLRDLTLMWDFHNQVLLLGALCILRSTPNLTTLTIKDSVFKWKSRQLENMEWECANFTLDKLTTLVVEDYNLYPVEREGEELHFVRFLLQNSPALRNMTLLTHILDCVPNNANYQPYTQAKIEYAFHHHFSIF